ncbi:MAG: helix-turn-helix domain-containing protein, partial [Panacagrimonas sp.]
NRRERQILALLDEGLSNARIAARCFLTEGTVKWYLHSLFVKFDVGNRTALLHAIRAANIKVSREFHAPHRSNERDPRQSAATSLR